MVNEEFCYKHSNTVSCSTCYECLKPICKECVINRDMDDYCPDCLKKVRRRSVFRMLMYVLAGAIILPLGIMCLHWGGSVLNYGKNALKIRQLKAYLANEPCDRRKTVELTETMLKAGDNRGVINYTNDFFDKCGEYVRLRWVTLSAYQYLSEWDNAIKDATVIIESNPYDKDYWWWRGYAYEQKGDLVKSAEDYEQSISLHPKLKHIPVNLAIVYERAGRYCDAAQTLQQFLYFYPDEDTVLQGRLAELSKKGECYSSVSGDKLSLKYIPSGPTIDVTVKINDKESGLFAVDTGATYVTLTKKFAERLGVPYKNGRSIYLNTAGGVRKGYLSMADVVQLGGLRARNVKIVVMDDMSGNYDGLLGLSFLNRFAVKIDAKKGLLELAMRKH